MRRFLFCEEQEGGMDHYVVEIPEGKELSFEWPIVGWMREECESEDRKLSFFAYTSRIGDFHVHRMGVAVRLTDA